MAAGQDVTAGSTHDVKGLPRNRPWLLPSNRKLRHLQGISLRNIELNKPPARPRGKTIDDESLPHALKTPAKLLAQREALKLEHSKSSTDLKQKQKEKSPERSFEAKRNSLDPAKDEQPLVKPVAQRLRRRSTMNWANSLPDDRQERLEEIANRRMADIWFSLHVEDGEGPIYVSETIERTMNPSFQFFDLDTYGAGITRRESLTINFWTRTGAAKSDILLMELTVNLRSLQFIGKTMDRFRHSLPSNAVLFHLSDGIYTSFTDLPDTESSSPTFLRDKASQNYPRTSSFDALMQLSNLDNCIQDALSTREKLAKQINEVLQQPGQGRDAMISVAQGGESLLATKRALSTCRKQVETAERRRSNLQASLAARREAIQNGRLAQHKAEKDLKPARTDLFVRKQDHQKTKTNIRGQIRRIGEDVSRIYPINSQADGSLAFTIHGLHLPFAAALAEKDPNTISAALGHAAHATHILSFYLSIPLPYPITPHSSTSTIYDPISTSMPSEAARTFPLYQKGAVGYRFEYGVFLLNTNVELLMSKQGARMMDLRYTLGNLKYVLTVITEGKGEIPGRKRGQFRALNGSARGSSRSSSMLSKQGEKQGGAFDRVFEAGELRRALDESRTG